MWFFLSLAGTAVHLARFCYDLLLLSDWRSLAFFILHWCPVLRLLFVLLLIDNIFALVNQTDSDSQRHRN